MRSSMLNAQVHGLPVPAVLSAVLTAAQTPSARVQDTVDGDKRRSRNAGEDRRPTVAVLDFQGGAFGQQRNADYAPITKSLALVLASTLGQNTSIRVVNRSALHEVLEEQKLSASGSVDSSTVVRIGKLLGVHHLLEGSFLVDGKNRMHLTVTSINTETGLQEYSQQVQGNGDDVEELILDMGARLNRGLQLPDMPVVARPARNSSSPRGSLRELVAIGRALDAGDRKNVAEEIALWKAFKKSVPQAAFSAQQSYADERIRLVGNGSGQ